MNKEQAKNIVKDFSKQIKDYGEDMMPEEKELSQALDIAIESLEQEENIEDCIIQLRAFDLTLKDLKEVGRIEESVFNTFSKIIKQIIDRLEPYVRSEE